MKYTSHLEQHIVYEGTLPAYTAVDYEPAIFNMPAFRALQSSAEMLSFYLLDPSGSRAHAGIYFYCDGRLAQSPYRAPFGSLECSKNLNPKILFGFLERLESALGDRGIREIRIKNPPRAYAPEQWSLVETFLANRNFEIAEAEVSAVIPVRGQPFADGIRHAEKLRLRQGKEAGFTFHNLPLSKLSDVFHFISECHRDKGYQLSITEGELQKTIRAFPANYRLFAVLREEQIVSASVAIRVKENILYNFLTNHSKTLNSLSPPVVLMEGMYDYCRKNSIGLMDLGTSALHGKPNFGLLDFKLHMGGLPTSKLSFHKIIV